MEKIYITEENDKWYLSYEKPAFQGGETIEIDKAIAMFMLKIQKMNSNKKELLIGDLPYDCNNIN